MTNNKRRNDPVTYGDFEDFSVALMADLKRLATKDDLERFATTDDLADVKSEVATVKQLQETTLEIVKSVDAQLKELRDLPHRVEKLESDVFQLKTRR